jgi:polygalacturonase
MKRLLILALLRTATARADFAPPEIRAPHFGETVFEARELGAAGDGKTNDTEAIDRAIEKCNSSGGGIAHFASGKYLVASVHLKSNVCLKLDDDAEIIGAKEGYDAPEPNPKNDKFQDFGHSHFHDAVMWGEDLENFAIIGGKVSGGGATQSDKVPPGGADKVVAIRTGKNLLFKNVTHDTGGHFVYLLNNCENITVDHVTIKKSRDAIDFLGCRNVAVTGCNFTGCSDDTLGIKSDYALGKKIDTENIYAWDDYFESGCNGLQFGSETAGDFRNVWIWNIKIGLAMKAGIGITSNDGAVIDDVHYKNITISHAANPIFMLLTRRLRTGEPNAKVGTIRNVHIEDVTCTDVVAGAHHGPANAATISGLPESNIENITLENVKITYKGGEDPKEATTQPIYPKDYSPNSMHIRPASGLYVRHVRGLTLKNVEIDYEKPTVKPVLVFFDVQKLLMDHLAIPKPDGIEAMRFEGVKDVQIKDCPGFKDEKIAQAGQETR